MRCNTCGEYIYKGKKFNSRKETVENENYLGLHIFRFYIKCPRCIAEIAFKTDPVNTDYELEAGATRNFEATRTAERMALQEQKEKEAEEANNPMKLLENRTKASCQEMEMLETLEDLRELRHRHSGINVDKMLQQNKNEGDQLLQKQEEEDEAFVRSIFGRDGTGIVVKRLDSDEEDVDSSNSDDEDNNSESSQHSGEPSAKVSRLMTASKPSDLLTDGCAPSTSQTDGKKPSDCSSAVWKRSVGTMKCQLSGLVRPKAAAAAASTPSSDASSSLCPPAATDIQPSAQEQCSSAVNGSGGMASSRAEGGDIVKSAGLAGLGAYSSSSSGDSDSDNV
jgi:hypothetical protein